MRRFWYLPKCENKKKEKIGVKGFGLFLPTPKKCRGVGLRKFHEINTALIAKIGWMVGFRPKKFSVQVLMAK